MQRQPNVTRGRPGLADAAAHLGGGLSEINKAVKAGQRRDGESSAVGDLALDRSQDLVDKRIRDYPGGSGDYGGGGNDGGDSIWGITGDDNYDGGQGPIPDAMLQIPSLTWTGDDVIDDSVTFGSGDNPVGLGDTIDVGVTLGDTPFDNSGNGNDHTISGDSEIDQMGFADDSGDNAVGPSDNDHTISGDSGICGIDQSEAALGLGLFDNSGNGNDHTIFGDSGIDQGDWKGDFNAMLQIPIAAPGEHKDASGEL